MVGYLRVAKVHNLGKVDLLARRGRPGILPHQSLAIEVVAAGALPAHELVGAVVGSALEERLDLLSAGEHAARLVQEPRDQRRLQGRIGQVQLERSVNGMGAGPPVSYTHLRAHETVLDLVCRL